MVSRCVFEKKFHDLKLTIKKPKIDTCENYNRLALKMEEGDTVLLKQKLDNHMKKAENAYDPKKKDKALAKKDLFCY